MISPFTEKETVIPKYMSKVRPSKGWVYPKPVTSFDAVILYYMYVIVIHGDMMTLI